MKNEIELNEILLAEADKILSAYVALNREAMERTRYLVECALFRGARIGMRIMGNELRAEWGEREYSVSFWLHGQRLKVVWDGDSMDRADADFAVYPPPSWCSRQCRNTNGYGPEGLYCKIHARMVGR